MVETKLRRLDTRKRDYRLIECLEPVRTEEVETALRLEVRLLVRLVH